MDAQPIDLSSLKPMSGGINLPEHELRQYHNAIVKIEKVETLQVPSTFTPVGADGKHLAQWCIKVISEPLGTFGEGENKIEIRASELFNLVQDKVTGALLGFPTGKDSNLSKFMADVQAKHPSELVGKKTTVKAYDKVVGDNKRIYFKFKY